MTILKYIINHSKIPVIFSNDIQHNDVLQSGISAGFLVIIYDQENKRFTSKCFGESTSLNLKSALTDVIVVEDYLNNSFLSDLSYL